MCLPVLISRSSKRSNYCPKPGPRPYKSKHQDCSPTAIPSSSSPDEGQKGHRSARRSGPGRDPRSRSPTPYSRHPALKYDGTKSPMRDHFPKTRNVSTYGSHTSKHPISCSGVKRQPPAVDRKHRDQIKAYEVEARKIDEIRHAMIEAAEWQQTQIGVKERQKAHVEADLSLLNGQGVSYHPKNRIVNAETISQGKKLYTDHSKPTRGNKTKEVRTLVLLNPHHKKDPQDSMPSIREAPEPRKCGSLRQPRDKGNRVIKPCSSITTKTGNIHTPHPRNHSDSGDERFYPCVEDFWVDPACGQKNRVYGCGDGYRGRRGPLYLGKSAIAGGEETNGRKNGWGDWWG